jgi:hypothetical protein
MIDPRQGSKWATGYRLPLATDAAFIAQYRSMLCTRSMRSRSAMRSAMRNISQKGLFRPYLKKN